MWPKQVPILNRQANSFKPWWVIAQPADVSAIC